ncbi:MAG: toll/interleukin-1 receptor domain-containing protein [Bacteroidetes bacterium]|nr:toll/interleukin-1 receptor domain-containing protein [Bacteroidota bacterium]
MSIELGNITGNGNVIGDRNVVKNNFMSEDALIRDEANEFSDLSFGKFERGFEGHKKIIESLQGELLRFYSLEAKMIFLDQVKLVVIDKKDKHQRVCTQQNCKKDKLFEKVLFFVQQEINSLPKILRKTTKDNDAKTGVFISYSHLDKDFLNDLKRHFAPLRNRVNFWEDSAIKVGQKWKDEIEGALHKAEIAIFLVSADFFNSKFVTDIELPTLLNKAEKEGTTIITVILKPCYFEGFPDLNQYQAINDPKRPISSMDITTREETWVELVRQVNEIIKSRG